MNRESKQAQALLRVFESLGVPLMGAVDEVLAWSQTTASPEETARTFAGLLSSSIAVGTQMSSKLGGANTDDAEAARLKAASLAGSVIAQHYVLTGQMPDDAFNKRLMDAFDGILSLADSFSYAGADNNDPADPVAARVLALTPFVQAIMRFPFGLSDSQLIRRLGEDLCERASQLAEAFSHGTPHDADVYAARELSFLKGCASLLARACDVEMNRLQQQQNAPAPEPEALLDAVWQRFEDSLDVLRAVVGFAVDPAGDASGTPAVKTSTPKAKTPPQMPPMQAVQDGPFNPMAFFVKKDEAGTGSEDAA